MQIIPYHPDDDPVIEALRAETAYFLKCIEENKSPFNDGVNGLEVVRLLEAAEKSVSKRGELVTL